MEPAVAVLAGLYFGIAIYLMLSSHIIRMLLGVALLGNGVNLTIFTVGRITREIPPIIGADAVVPMSDIANPLPQALVLTAIVISFSFFAFLLVLAFRTYQELSTDDTNDMRAAEPADEPGPPIGY